MNAKVDQRETRIYALAMRWAAISIVLGGLFGAATTAPAQADSENSFLAQTQIVHLSFDGMNSGIVRQAARDSFELSGGGLVDLSRWYSPEFPNVSAVFSTQINPELALLWGGSVGERGPKYALGPSGVVGLNYRRAIGRRSTLSLEVVGQFGGALNEESCIGDYGALGGAQRVNCRLAATVLSPLQTLSYLWDEPATMTASFKLIYQIHF